MIKSKTISASKTACTMTTGFLRATIGNHKFITHLAGQGRIARRYSKAVRTGLAVLAVWSGALQAGNIYVPNGSFEQPETVFADPRNDLWQESPKPVWYDEQANGPWGQLTGVFLNTATTNIDYIDNMDGKQGAFFFALPGVALFQDYLSTYGTNASPAHDFNARFEVGKSYQLTVGVIGGGGGMSNGVTLELSLYYRDGASNRVTVAATTVTNEPANFSNTTHFIDFQVQLPAVKAGDAWAGQHIGVQLLSTVGFDLASGYWDLDNVRLTETIEVPNGSFEQPATVFADPRNDLWQESPKPVWYDEQANGPWGQLTGVFLNTATTNIDYIDNMDGKQGAFFFALPGVALFQDYLSTYGANASPAHDFNTRFEVGKSYQLTVGVIGGGGGMSNGVTMELSLYYRDGASNRVTVAATTITNEPANFSNTTHFIDFQVQLPAVKAGDAWAGQHIGVQLLSTVGFDLASGYWDLDNVRLTSVIARRFCSLPLAPKTSSVSSCKANRDRV